LPALNFIYAEYRRFNGRYNAAAFFILNYRKEAIKRNDGSISGEP
jgi:hypothetical protein